MTHRDAGAASLWSQITSSTQPALRCHRDLPGRLIGAEAQQRRDIAGAIQIAVLLEIEQFDVATDGDGNDGVANVVEFASEASASDARRHQVGVEVAAVRALDRSSRIVVGEKNGLHFPAFQRLQHAAEAGDTASVGLGEIHRFVGLGGSRAP